jgi:hypothetical protein
MVLPLTISYHLPLWSMVAYRLLLTLSEPLVLDSKEIELLLYYILWNMVLISKTKRLCLNSGTPFKPRAYFLFFSNISFTISY